MDRSPAAAGYRGAIHNLAFPLALAQALTETGRRRRATLFMTLLAAFDILLWHHSGAEDILVGSPIAGRTQRETDVAILLAARVDGLLNREIAEQFGISLRLVESELSAAMKYCLQRMQEDGDPYSGTRGGPRKF